MAEHSEGRTDEGSGAASSPVFVDNSGGRRRRWRRLGWALGAAGGGYALVVAVSMIGGNSDAPWGVLIPGSGEGSGAARVVPEPAEDDGELTPGAASGHSSGEPGPGASDPAAVARFADEARVPRTSPEPAPGARASVGPDAGKAAAGGGKGSKGGATTGGSGGATPTPVRPSADPASGGAATGSTGAPTEPGTEPSPDPTASSGPSPQGGLLDRIVDQLGGGPATGATASGATASSATATGATAGEE